MQPSNHSRREAKVTSVQDTSLVIPKLLDLTDFSLNLAGYLFNGTFRFHLWIIAQITGDLLDLPFHFVKLAFHLVFRARFHVIIPHVFRSGYLAILLSMTIFRQYGDSQAN
jgi:hypothetical protein